MKIGIISRIDLEKALDLTKETLEHFSDEEVLLSPKVAEKLGEKGTPIEKMDAEALITVGGDGTVLYTVQKAPNTPILGINMGGRGFLADVNPEEASEALNKLKKGELETLERERVKVKISGNRMAECLNEGVIRSKEPSRNLFFRILLNGEEVEKNRGDGVLISTPTGSTAYAMSAGGPIIDPRLEAFVAVPLSTHRPRALPLVFPMSSKLEVELLEYDRKADVTADGQVSKEAEKGDVISFEKSENSAKFYKWRGKFYEKMREKL